MNDGAIGTDTWNGVKTQADKILLLSVDGMQSGTQIR